MPLQVPSRRGFLTGLGAFFCAAPAIVRAASIMPVRTIEDYVDIEMDVSEFAGTPLYAALAAATRRGFMPRLFVQLYSASPILSVLADLEA